MISDEISRAGQATGLLGYQKTAHPTVYTILVVTANKLDMTEANRREKKITR